MRCVFGNVVAGGLALALSSGLGWAQTPKANSVGAPKGAAAEAADINGGPVQMVATASLHLANAVADLREKNLDGALNKIVLAAKAMRGLTAALGAEQDKADALARDLEAARAEIAALKPRAAAQADLSREQQRADQREAYLQQERQRAQALTRELAAAQADQASLSQERQKADQRETELKRERQRAEALARDLDAARAEVAALKPQAAAQDKADALVRDLQAARAEVAALKPQAAAQARLDQERRKADQREAELQQERQKTEVLVRELEAARAEITALKPQAAAQAGLAQERRRADQREAELKQERQKVEALTRELAAARADQASLSEERRRAEILGKLVQEFKREGALKRERQAARADAAPKPAGSGQNGSTEPMPTVDRASRVPALSQSVQAQRASDGTGQGGAGVQRASLGSTVTGRSEVVNNATLRINGSIVRLIGVEPASEAEREQMAHYLGDRTVTCWPVSSGVRHRCEVEGNDLSRVVLYNGGGRATPEATPDLLADENHARLARIGVWRE